MVQKKDKNYGMLIQGKFSLADMIEHVCCSYFELCQCTFIMSYMTLYQRAGDSTKMLYSTNNKESTYYISNCLSFIWFSVKRCPALQPGEVGTCHMECDFSQGPSFWVRRRCPTGKLCCSNGCGRVCVDGVEGNLSYGDTILFW